MIPALVANDNGWQPTREVCGIALAGYPVEPNDLTHPLEVRASLEAHIFELIAALDILDGDPDLEDTNDAEDNRDDLEWILGWGEGVRQTRLRSTDECEWTALERHGLGLVRSGPDDAEDGLHL